MKPGMENSNAMTGISNVLLDFNEINIIRITMLEKKIIQNPNPKNAVNMNVEGFMKGQKAHSNDDKRAAIPQTPIIDFPNP